MTEEGEHPFKPGLEVAIVNRRYSFSIRRATVNKLHKSGRFTLTGSSQQWKASLSGWGDKTWFAWSTNSRWDSDCIELITPALMKEAEGHALVRRGRKAIDRMKQPKGGVFSVDVVNDLERLADLIAPKEAAVSK